MIDERGGEQQDRVADEYGREAERGADAAEYERYRDVGAMVHGHAHAGSLARAVPGREVVDEVHRQRLPRADAETEQKRNRRQRPRILEEGEQEERSAGDVNGLVENAHLAAMPHQRRE